MGTADDRGLALIDIVANERQAQATYMVEKHTDNFTIHNSDQTNAFNKCVDIGPGRSLQKVNHSGTIDQTGVIHYFKDPNTGTIYVNILYLYIYIYITD